MQKCRTLLSRNVQGRNTLSSANTYIHLRVIFQLIVQFYLGNQICIKSEMFIFFQLFKCKPRNYGAKYSQPQNSLKYVMTDVLQFLDQVNRLCNKCVTVQDSHASHHPIMSWRMEMDTSDILPICCVSLGAGTSKRDASLELSVQSNIYCSLAHIIGSICYMKRSLHKAFLKQRYKFKLFLGRMQYYFSILYTVEQRESNGKKIHYMKGKRSLSKALLTHIFTSCLDEHHSNISPPGIFLQLCVLAKIGQTSCTLVNLMS